MKALTVKQPWAWAITGGTKRVENRTWKPPFYIIGQRIAIHSSARIDKAELLAYTALGAWLEPTVNALPTGSIVGTAIVAGYSVMEGNRMTQQSKGAQGYNPRADPWFCGPVGWLLSNVRKIDPPLSCKGALGLWNVPEEYLPLLEAAR